MVRVVFVLPFFFLFGTDPRLFIDPSDPSMFLPRDDLLTMPLPIFEFSLRSIDCATRFDLNEYRSAANPKLFYGIAEDF